MTFDEKLIILRDKTTTASQLSELIVNERSIEVIESVIRHPNCSNELIEDLIKNNLINKYFAFCRKFNSTKIAKTLAPYQSFFEKIEENKTTWEHYSSLHSWINSSLKTYLFSETIFKELSKDKDKSISNEIAFNPNIPTFLLEEFLSKTPSYELYKALAINTKSSNSILEKLITLKATEVKWLIYNRKGLKINLKNKLSLFHSFFDQINVHNFTFWHQHSLQIAVNKIELSEELINELLTDISSIFKPIIAGHKSTPQTILMDLAKSSDNACQYEVAKNPITTTPILEHLLFEGDYKVLIGLAENPNTPLHLVLLIESKIKSVKTAVENHILTTPSYPKQKKLVTLKKWQRTVAKNPNLAKDLIEKLATHKDYSVRAAIANNPSTPLPIITFLSNDKDDVVKNTALIMMKKLSVK